VWHTSTGIGNGVSVEILLPEQGMTLTQHLRAQARPQPVSITVDFPFPPSSNRLWRGGVHRKGYRVFLEPNYRKWKHQAGLAVMTLRPRPQMIAGAFVAHIWLDRSCNRSGDLDNRVKPVLDAAQTFGLIEDDRNCRMVHVEWASAIEAPAGCRLRLVKLAEGARP
jgi:Holliday junction resolvase RusA-like endonuclease